MADFTGLILAVIIGALAAIIYSLRILVLMDRKIERIEQHLEKITYKTLKEENKEINILEKKKPKKAVSKKRRR